MSEAITRTLLIIIIWAAEGEFFPFDLEQEISYTSHGPGVILYQLGQHKSAWKPELCMYIFGGMAHTILGSGSFS